MKSASYLNLTSVSNPAVSSATPTVSDISTKYILENKDTNKNKNRPSSDPNDTPSDTNRIAQAMALTNQWAAADNNIKTTNDNTLVTEKIAVANRNIQPAQQPASKLASLANNPNPSLKITGLTQLLPLPPIPTTRPGNGEEVNI